MLIKLLKMLVEGQCKTVEAGQATHFAPPLLQKLPI